MVLVEELFELIRKRGGKFGVEVGDVRYQVDEVVELFDIFTRGGGRRRDENLPLRIVCEPLIVEFLGVRPASVG